MASADKLSESAENTFIGHLLELRRRVLFSVIALFIGFLISYPFAQQIYGILAQPLIAVLPKGSHLLVALEERDLHIDQVLGELQRREGVSGLVEKASRQSA